MGDARIAALADLQGLKARKEPALPFIGKRSSNYTLPLIP
jgi:hypothetical protein